MADCRDTWLNLLMRPLLGLGWSAEQIAGRRKRIEQGMEQQSGLSVSHEAIYTAIYALPRGALRRELISCLRQDKPTRGRKPKGSERRGKLQGMTNIEDRPEEIKGRLVPGHWEGDLILGAAAPARSAPWWSARPVLWCWCGCRRARPTSRNVLLPEL